MTRAVLDSNVVVSALIQKGGIPRQVVEAALAGGFSVVVSASLIAELTEVLGRARVRRRVGATDEQIASFVSDLFLPAILVEPDVELDVVRDPADNRVLEAAVAGGADYVVTGDQDLLVLSAYGDIRIVTPAQFVAVLSEEA